MKQSHYLYTHMHTLKHCKTYKFHKISQVLCFLLGALSVDEALCLVQAICAGNAGSMGFVLMPQPHSSCSHTAILTHRRLLEDKAVATLDGTFWKTCQDCILDVKFGMCSFLLGMKVCVCVFTCGCPSFKGLRRARNQPHLQWQCARWRSQKNQPAMFSDMQIMFRQPQVSWTQPLFFSGFLFVWGLALTSGQHGDFTRAKAFRGSITAISRSRVSDLQNPELDKPLAPHWRASRIKLCEAMCSQPMKFGKPLLWSFSIYSEAKVQQRGVGATGEVLDRLLEGLALQESHPVLIIDCLPNRFLGWEWVYFLKDHRAKE